MIKHTTIATVLWLALLWPSFSKAQEQTPYYLNSLWLEVQQNYPGLKAQNAQLSAKELDQKYTKGAALPQLKIQGQNTYSSLEPAIGGFFAQPGIFTVNPAQINPGEKSTTFNTYASSTLQWEVFSFGKIKKQNQSAQALYDKAVGENQSYLLELKKILSQRYISFLYHRAKQDWSQNNMQRLDDIRKITSSLSLAGLKPQADSLLASSTFMNAKGDYSKMQGLAQGAWIKVLELTQNQALGVEPELDVFFNPKIKQESSQETIDLSHPVLKTIHAESDFYALNAQVQKTSYLPSVNLLGGYAFRTTGVDADNKVSRAWEDGFSNSTRNFAVGVGITWNITNLHTNRLKSKSYLEKAKSSQLRLQEYHNAMQADLQALQVNLHYQYMQLQDNKSAVEQSKKAYNMYLARYKSGLISLTELLQIRLVLEQSENSFILASKDYWDLLAYEAELTADFSFLFSNL
ncbi:TolC family protein [Myroides sp. LJL119]